MIRSITEIAEILGVETPLNKAEIRSLLTDSRSLEQGAGTLFFAIKTTGNDGHRYIGELYEKGVRNFVVTKLPADIARYEGSNFLKVDDSVAALQRICRRGTDFKGEILGITGSRGKTTLKEWIFQLMEPMSEISRSPRSYNSQIGVPLSMWELSDATSLGVIEAGVSRKGEMNSLAQCIEPDTVIITNIGEAHSEGFANDEEKAIEKAKLAAGINVKSVIYRYGDQLIEGGLNVVAPTVKRVRWSTEDRNAEVYAEVKRMAGEMELTYIYEGKGGTLRAPLTGDEDLENAMNALTFMLIHNIDPDVIASRFAELHKIGTRLNVTEGINGCTVIHDSYTSDFSSLRPALDFMRRRVTKDQSLTLILSDLHHESGESSEMYEKIASLLTVAGVSRLIGVGPVIRKYSDLFKMEAAYYDDSESMLAEISRSDFTNELILLKGSPEYDLSGIAELLERRRHETVLEVNLDSIVSNYNYFRRHVKPGTGIVCMVKASGYGAGSYEIAKTLQDCGAAYLAVAVLDEGIELREKGITMPVMVMNPKSANYQTMFSYRLEPEIYSFEMLEDVIREARKSGIKDYPIHIKLDTGMHRMGFAEDDLPRLMDILEQSGEVMAKSTFTHLATADCLDMDDYTELQLSRFKRFTEYMLSRSKTPILRHVLNTAGILRYPEHDYDMVRLGIGLYGANTLPAEIEQPLKVVSTLRTVIFAISEYKAGESIGYGRKGMLSRDSKIATIPIGYADGMNRHFGNGNIRVLVNGKEAPTIGNICMDACMIDVTGIECKVGDMVEIFGENMDLQRLADQLDTIPYEVLTSISPRVKRIYYRE